MSNYATHVYTQKLVIDDNDGAARVELDFAMPPGYFSIETIDPYGSAKIWMRLDEPFVVCSYVKETN